MMIGGWERQGLVRFLALGSEGAFDPKAHPHFLSPMILCSFQGSILISASAKSKIVLANLSYLKAK